MKSKKLISLLCAGALTASSFAAFAVTASAAAGDTVSTSTFEDAAGGTTTEVDKWALVDGAAASTKVNAYSAWTGNNWGGATGQVAVYYGNATEKNTYFADVIGTQKVDNTTVWTDTYTATTVEAPSVVGTKSLYFATQHGMNKTITLTISPTVPASSTKNYGVNFDMLLTDAAYGAEHEGKREYTISLSDILKLDIIDGDLYYFDGTTKIDTGIDLPVEGKWYNFDLKVDMENKQFKGTIKAYDGDTLGTTAAAEIQLAAFAGTATSITTLAAESVRYDGGNKGAVNCAIDNFVVKEVAPTGYDSVTVNFKSASTTLKTTTVLAETGTTFTASDAYKVPFATETSREAKKYYVYDTTSTDSVAVAEGAVINLNFTESAMPKTSVVGVVQGTETQIGEIVSDYVVPGEKVTGYAHQYMKGTDNKWYEKVDVLGGPRTTYPTYDVTATGGTEAVTVNVAYKPAYNVVEYIEAEDDETATADSSSTYSTNYPKLYASGGQWRKSGDAGDYVTGFYTSAVEKAGTYEITVRSYGPDKRSGAIGTLDRADKENKYAVKIAELNTDGLNTTTATADLEAGNVFWVGKNSADMSSSKSTAKKMDEIDYIVVKDKSLDAAPVPEVTIGNISAYNETVQLTLTNSEEFLPLGINPKVTLIQAVYDGTTLSDVKVWNNIEISSQTGGVTEEISDAMFDEDSVFYVWDAVGGVRPLGAAKPYTAELI